MEVEGLSAALLLAGAVAGLTLRCPPSALPIMSITCWEGGTALGGPFPVIHPCSGGATNAPMDPLVVHPEGIIMDATLWGGFVGVGWMLLGRRG